MNEQAEQSPGGVTPVLVITAEATVTPAVRREQEEGEGR